MAWKMVYYNIKSCGCPINPMCDVHTMHIYGYLWCSKSKTQHIGGTSSV